MSVDMTMINPLVPGGMAQKSVGGEYCVEKAENLTETSFLELVQSHRQIYAFMVFMGMIRVDKDFRDCGYSSGFVTFWNNLLMTMILVYILPQVAEAFTMLYYWDMEVTEVTIIFIWVVVVCVQLYVIVYGVQQLRRRMSERELMNREWYMAAFEYCLPTCRYILWFLIVCSFLGLVFFCDFLVSSYGSAVVSWVSVGVVTLQVFVNFAGSFLLVGSLFVLVVEQRISLMTMKQLVERAKNKAVDHAVYFETRNDIKRREDRLPINIVLLAAIANAILGIVFLILYVSLTNFLSQRFWLVYTVFLELSVFGREVLFLLVLLYEVVQVNDQAQRMIQILAEEEWGSAERESVRHSVFMACIGKPIGATIFYHKPTRNQILLQMLASVVATLLALLKAYFLSKDP